MSEQSGKHPDFGRSTALFNHHRYPTAREFCRVILRLVDSEQSDKHRKRVKPVRFYGVPLLSIPFARTFRLRVVALRDLESFVIQNHAALGSLQTAHRTTAYTKYGNCRSRVEAVQYPA